MDGFDIVQVGMDRWEAEWAGYVGGCDWIHGKECVLVSGRGCEGKCV